MSWHGGTEVMGGIIDALLKTKLDPEERTQIYSAVADSLYQQDWHDHLELMGADPAYDRYLLKDESERVEYNIAMMTENGSYYRGAASVEEMLEINATLIESEGADPIKAITKYRAALRRIL